LLVASLRRWAGVLLGVAVGIAIVVLRISPESAMASQVFAFVFLPLVIIPLHELGHAVAGRLVGFRIVGVTLGSGPLLLRTTVLGVKVRIKAVPIIGLTMAFPQGDGPTQRWRHWIFTAGGPMANVLIYFGLRGIFGPAALHDFKHHPLAWTAIWTNWWVLAANLFPFHTKEGQASDGYGLFTIPFWSAAKRIEVRARTAAAKAGHALIHGDLAAARRAADDLRREAPASPWSLVAVASVEHAHHRHEVARDLYRKALAATSEARPAAVLKNNIAFMSVALGRDEDLPEADRLSSEALAFFPDIPSVSGTRGAVLLRMGRVKEAWPLLLASEADADSNRNLAYAKSFVACALARRGEHDAALRKLAEARQADPSCDLLARAEADIATAATSPTVEPPPDVAAAQDVALHAAALQRWRRDTRVVAFAAIFLASNRLGSVPPALLVVLLTLSLTPEGSAALALATSALWTAALIALGLIKGDITSPIPAGAVPTAAAIGIAAGWVAVRYRRLQLPPKSRVPTALGWVLAGLSILFALPSLFRMTLGHSALTLSQQARDFAAPSVLLLALLPILLTRRSRWLRALAVLPAVPPILMLVAASDWYVNHVALARTTPDGAAIAWADPVPARVLRTRTLTARGHTATLSPGATAFFVRRSGWHGLSGGLTVADFADRAFEVPGDEGAFIDDDRLLVVRKGAGKSKDALLVELRLSRGADPVWTKPLPNVDPSDITIEIDRAADRVYLLNDDTYGDQARVFRTTAEATTPIEWVETPAYRTQILLGHCFGPAGWRGSFVTRTQQQATDIWWLHATSETRVGPAVRHLDCPRAPFGDLVLWCLVREVPILFKLDATGGTVTRVPDELPYNWSRVMLARSRLAILGHAEIGVVDLNARRGTRLRLPDTEDRSPYSLAEGGLATLAHDKQQATLVVYAEP
jgi:tetratricopeptide (TPR) repeat protein